MMQDSLMNNNATLIVVFIWSNLTQRNQYLR